jgi:proteic killer suppression protein
MIKSFRHKGLEDLFYTGSKKGVKPENAQKILDILDRLDAAKEVRDMSYPGSNLHQLIGKRKGQWAVRVTGNWRIIFSFEEDNVYDVDYMDYH